MYCVVFLAVPLHNRREALKPLGVRSTSSLVLLIGVDFIGWRLQLGCKVVNPE